MRLVWILNMHFKFTSVRWEKVVQISTGTIVCNTVSENIIQCFDKHNSKKQLQLIVFCMFLPTYWISNNSNWLILFELESRKTYELTRQDSIFSVIVNSECYQSNKNIMEVWGLIMACVVHTILFCSLIKGRGNFFVWRVNTTMFL